MGNFVFGQTGAGNNWAKGHYTEGAELMILCSTWCVKRPRDATVSKDFRSAILLAVVRDLVWAPF